jgi:hypothetical protein
MVNDMGLGRSGRGRDSGGAKGATIKENIAAVFNLVCVEGIPFVPAFTRALNPLLRPGER